MSRKILLIGIVFLLFSRNAWTDNNELADVYYQSGLALIKQSKYEEAVGKLEQAVSYKNDFPAALFKLGECYEKIKHTLKAIEAFRLCLKHLNAKPDLDNNEKGILPLVTKNLDRLDKQGSQARDIKSKYIDKLLALANESLAKKHTSLAERIYRLILRLDPGNKIALGALAKDDSQDNAKSAAVAAAHCKKGYTYYEQSEMDKAIAEYNEAIEADPKCDEAYVGRASARFLTNDLNGALADCNQALKLNPKSAAAYSTRGICYNDKGQFSQALGDCSMAIKLAPDYAEAYFNRSIIHANMNNFKTAVSDAEKFIKLSPRHRAAAEAQTLIADWKSKIK